MSGVTTVGRAVWRRVRLLPDFLFGDNSEIIGKAMRGKKGSIFEKAHAGLEALEKDVNKKSKTQGNFFKRLWKGLESTPSDCKKNISLAKKVASKAGKGSTWAVTRGIGKTVAKKLPLVGTLLTLVLDGPDIVESFIKYGPKEGFKALGGTSYELGLTAAGAAIGSAICPGIGTVIGGIVGGLVGAFSRDAIFGNLKINEDDNLKDLGLSDEDIKEYRNAGYTYEQIIEDLQNKDLKARGLSDEEIEKYRNAGKTYEQIIEDLESSNESTSVEYSKSELAELKKLGLDDEDIEYAKGHGYSVDDVKQILMLGELVEQGNGAKSVEYSKSEIKQLKDLGLGNKAIEFAQQKGLKFSEVKALLQHTEANEGNSARSGSSTSTNSSNNNATQGSKRNRGKTVLDNEIQAKIDKLQKEIKDLTNTFQNSPYAKASNSTNPFVYNYNNGQTSFYACS